MKRNAIARIVIYSFLILFLTAILLGVIAADLFSFRQLNGSAVTEGEVTFEAAQIEELSIDWAAGNVDIQITDTDQITLRETAPEDCKYKLTYEISGNTLKISYGSEIRFFGFGTTIPSKDLLITVPSNWVCKELEIDGAALEVSVNGLNAKAIELDGAAMEFAYSGAFDTLDCDGAGCEMDIAARNSPNSITFDGAGCELKLSLPEDCGFAARLEGLGFSFDSDVQSYFENGAYRYGDGHCQIEAEGLGCNIGVYYSSHDVAIEDKT